MTLEILRFGSIKAAASNKATTIIPLERSLSFMILLPVKSVVRNFRNFRVSTRRDRFNSRTVDKRDQAAPPVPHSLFIFPGGLDIQRAAVFHFNHRLNCVLTRGRLFTRGNRALVELNR